MFTWSYQCSLAEEGPLGGVVKNIISDIGKRGTLTEEEMLAAWEAVAGRRAAKHARPASLKKSKLVVNVDGSSWLYELTLKKKEILRRLGEELGNKKVSDIRFRIGEVRKVEKDKT